MNVPASPAKSPSTTSPHIGLTGFGGSLVMGLGYDNWGKFGIDYVT